MDDKERQLSEQIKLLEEEKSNLEKQIADLQAEKEQGNYNNDSNNNDTDNSNNDDDDDGNNNNNWFLYSAILARLHFKVTHMPHQTTNNVRILPGTYLCTWVESSNVEKMSC